MATIKDHMSARQNLQQLHQDIDTLYYHETLMNDRGDTENMSSLDLPEGQNRWLADTKR